MSSIYGNHGAGSSSIYRSGSGTTHYHGGSGPPPRRKKKKGGGFFHAVGEAVTNTGHAIAGVGPGIYETGKAIGEDAYQGGLLRHPGRGQTYKKVIKPAAQAYAHKYGPLVHGDFGEFAHRALVEDPLGTVADVATAATLGAAAGAKVGLIPEAARSVELRSPGVLAGQEGAKTVRKGIAGSHFSRHLRVAADKTLKKLPPDFPVLGEVNRYGKAIRMREARTMLHHALKAQPYLKSERALSREERVAANVIHDYPSRKLLEEYKASLADRPEAAPTLKLLNNKKVLRYFTEPTPKMKAYLEESGRLGDLSVGLSGLEPGTVEARRYQQSLLLRGAHIGDEGLTAPEGSSIPDMIQSIKGELGAEGRPEPLYRKHVSVEEKRGIRVGHGGGAPQSATPPIHQSRAILAAMGRVAHDIDSLTPAYMKVVKWATYTDRHADLLESGVKVPKGIKLREGEEFLKQKPSEKIPYTEQTAGEFERNLGGDLKDHLVTNQESQAFETPDGYRVVIPTKLREKVVGEYHKSHKAIEWFWNKPTAVWRALVLNLSPRWLVNNLVGNTLMYTVRTAGSGGVRAWLQAVSDLRGPEFVRKMVLGDREVRGHLTPADMAEVLPEHVQGTFFGTQTPKGKISKYSPTRPLRAADVAYEKSLRRAIANQVLRKSPEVKARLKAMPGETRSWRAAAKEELASNPTLADRVSQEINNALGDYSNLSALESGVLRQFVPFYAWYRAITMVMVKMPVDNPLRTSILYNLGKIGEANQAKGYPFGGAIDLGGGSILKTTGLNPYETVPQLVENLKTLGQAGAAGFPGTHIKPPDSNDLAFAAGIFNPLYAGPFTGGYGRVIEKLPEYQIAQPSPSKLYDDAGRRAAVLAWLGVPTRHLRNP